MKHRARRPGWLPAPNEAMRLIAMLVVLAIMGLTIYRWRPQGRVQPAVGPASAHPATAPEESAPPDAVSAANSIDPAEMELFREEAKLVSDKSIAIHPIEMPAYARLFHWTEERTAEQLRSQSHERTFHDLIHSPAECRGELLRVELDVRRVLSYPTPKSLKIDAPQLYELWGWPTANSGWLYVVVTPDLPPSLTVGDFVQGEVTVYGYFFKLQGYYPADAKPQSRALFAPLLVGRVVAQPGLVVPRENPYWSYVALVVGVVILSSMAGAWVYRRRAARRQPPLVADIDDLDLPSGDVGEDDEPPSVDDNRWNA